MPDRSYTVHARSTDTFGRVLVSAREHHFVIDGPVQNGCPGEEVTPAEAFLGAVASCSVELMQVIAKETEIAIGDIAASIEGTIPAERIREDVNLFSTVVLNVELSDVSDAEAEALVEGFKRRCPLYGTVAVATPDVRVEWVTR